MSDHTDFDFLHGEWRVCGIGNVDEFLLPPLDASGATLRLFDRSTRRWALHWASSLTGRLDRVRA
jgi:hypothetical protein